MAVLKINPADLMKSDNGNDSIDTFVRQTMGKEPYISFSRANDSPVQWFQLLNALEQQELPGWSLLSPMNIQMQKCDKCSREFCSTISYRRHLRLHRRKLNFDKDSATKIRGLLDTFWNKLTVEEAIEIMSFDDVSLAGVSGSSIITTLTSFIRKLGYASLPPSYVKSGSILLDIVQGRPSRFPISSQELFNILEGASENTFLCAGTAESLQKFVFDGDAGKIGLEMRNVVACTSFLVEQKLVKACLADKDAEALRYQKLLVEEEEAAQKRQAVLLEKKRLKKLRQKDHRAKEVELPIGEDDDSQVESPPSPSSSILVDECETTGEMLDVPFNAAIPSPEPSQLANVEEGTDKDQENRHPDYVAHQKIEHRRAWHQGTRRHQNHLKNSNGFHASQNYQALKPIFSQKRPSSRNFHTAANNSTKVWTPKPKSETREESSKTSLLVYEAKLPCPGDTKLLIGSIPILLNNHILRRHDGNLCGSSENFGNSEVGGVLRSHSDVAHTTLIVETTFNDCKDEFGSCLEAGHQGDTEFSSREAEAFLSQRWKEAMIGDHVELVLFSEEPPGTLESQDDIDTESDFTSMVHERIVLCSAENLLPFRSDIDSSMKSKTRGKPTQKGGNVKYIQKQRTGF